MKIDRLETHDRFQYFTRQGFDIGECVQDLVSKKPFGEYPFYVFAHARTDDDGTRKRLIWQPRLTKPKAQTNSMLFKAYPGTDLVKIIWMIPPRELWKQFKPGQMTHNKTVWDSIQDFVHSRVKLEAKEPDDLSDDMIYQIYKSMSLEMRHKKMIKQATLVESSIVLEKDQ